MVRSFTRWSYFANDIPLSLNLASFFNYWFRLLCFKNTYARASGGRTPLHPLKLIACSFSSTVLMEFNGACIQGNSYCCVLREGTSVWDITHSEIESIILFHTVCVPPCLCSNPNTPHLTSYTPPLHHHPHPPRGMIFRSPKFLALNGN